MAEQPFNAKIYGCGEIKVGIRVDTKDGINTLTKIPFLFFNKNQKNQNLISSLSRSPSPETYHRRINCSRRRSPPRRINDGSHDGKSLILSLSPRLLTSIQSSHRLAATSPPRRDFTASSIDSITFIPVVAFVVSS
ncbi:hypothetical protein CARUB_v10014895mg [Capsella rubella]|uniref:Uncharacterized protein n=1 Tax=Capsella rubella TaxID=81985 RepID=R0I1C1_9BRAS|nr:hypothetical protein CARUB_v10014895mg [Capsella rubella]